MTKHTSFSTMLQTKLAEDRDAAIAAQKAREKEKWDNHVCSISEWLEKVFNDESYTLLGYKLKTRQLSRDGDYTLVVYYKVGNLVFGLELQQDFRKTCYRFGICTLLANDSARFCRLQHMYKATRNFLHLEFEHGSERQLHDIAISFNSAQGIDMRKRLCEEIVAATVIVLQHQPQLASPETAEAIVKAIAVQRNVHMKLPDSEITVSSPETSLSTEDYLAKIPSEILNMTIDELVSVPNTENMGTQRAKEQLGYLYNSGVGVIKDVLMLDISDLRRAGNYGWWATTAVIEALARLGLEIVPPKGNEYLPEGVPKTVSRLLEESGMSYIERPLNCLGRAQIVTTQQLLLQTESDLLALTNFGQKSLATVVEALAQHGLSLAPEEP